MNFPDFKNKKWKTVLIGFIFLIGIYGLLVMTFFVYAVYKESHWEHHREISNTLGFYHSNKGGYIYDLATKEIIIPDVDCVVEPNNNDSIAIFHWGEKRGYFNINNGLIVAQPQYEAAWVFRSGVGGVAKNDSVFFIGLDGKPVNDKKLRRVKGFDYIYNGDYCIIKSGEKYGAIDKSGEWVLNPEWDYIESTPQGLLIAWRNGRQFYAYDKNDIRQFPESIEIKNDTIIVYSDSTRIYVRQ